MSRPTIGDPGQDGALDALLADYRETKKQRDELLAACKELCDAVTLGECLTDTEGECSAIKSAQAAIARCQPAEKTTSKL